MNYLFPPAPIEEPLDSKAPRWRQFWQNITDTLSAAVRRAPAAETPAASPWTYQYIGPGRTLLIVAGTVTKVELSRDGISFYQIAIAPGAYPMLQGDYLRITHAGITSATLMPQ